MYDHPATEMHGQPSDSLSSQRRHEVSDGGMVDDYFSGGTGDHQDASAPGRARPPPPGRR